MAIWMASSSLGCCGCRPVDAWFRERRLLWGSAASPKALGVRTTEGHCFRLRNTPTKHPYTDTTFSISPFVQTGFWSFIGVFNFRYSYIVHTVGISNYSRRYHDKGGDLYTITRATRPSPHLIYRQLVLGGALPVAAPEPPPAPLYFPSTPIETSRATPIQQGLTSHW